MKQSTNRNPWLWVPTLYLAEGLPYFIVNETSSVMFTNMGMKEGEMSLYTSLLYLPWVIKPFWCPFVDVFKTKRWWIISMQIFLSVVMCLFPFVLPQGSGEYFASNPMFFVTLGLFWITAFSSATHDIAADGFYMLGLNTNQQTKLIGIRNTFYRIAALLANAALVAIAGLIHSETSDYTFAWQVTMILPAVIMAGLAIYNSWSLPKPSEDASSDNANAKEVWHELLRTLGTFFKKKYLVLTIVFLLLYRLPEAFLIKMLKPFMLTDVANGGLGMSNGVYSLIYSTVGMVALLAGGVLGGLAVSKWGFKKSIWPMAMSLCLPCLSFVFLSAFHVQNYWVIGSCVALDQFGYGFGFTAYMLYMIYFSRGEFKTAHYSICTGFMALSMTLPGLVAGYLKEWLGYTNFFIFVMVCCLVTVGVTFIARSIVDPEFGKK